MTGRVATVGAVLFLAVSAALVLSVAGAGASVAAGLPSDSPPGAATDSGDSTPAAVAGSTDSTSVAVTESPVSAAGPDEVDPDGIEIDVVLAEDGSAEWEIQFLVALDDDDGEAAFADLEDDVAEDPDPYVERFADRIDSTVENAAASTGRSMHADGYDVRTERQSLAREYGVLTYSFTWHGFAAVDGDELRAGDAIDRYYLDEDTRLAVSWPEGYELRSVAPEPDDERERTVVWRGSETDFVSGEPRVVVASDGLFSSAALVLGGLAAVGLAVAGIAWWARSRGGAVDSTDDADGSTSSGAAGAEGDERNRTDADSDGEEPPRPDPAEFLSNEERVLGLLEERGGRMKQQRVVQELGWTDAKTSQVVTGLREDGDLESFRIGRENVLVLPGEEREADEADI